MTCEDRNLQLNALLDGELPAADTAELTAHLAACPECARRLAELAELRAALAEAIPEEEILVEFQSRIAGVLDRAGKEAAVVRFKLRAWGAPLAALAVGAAVAAMLVVAVLPNAHQQGELMAVRDAALRGAEVAAAGAAPEVPGFRLTGARQDEVAGHRAEVAAYVQAGEKVTLCIWPANGEPAQGVRAAHYRGMAISYWNDGKQEYWAASTGSSKVLATFVATVRASDATT